MTISNDDGNNSRGPLENLLRLQTDFQHRLAEETLKYLRQLQGLVGPVVPGTVIAPNPREELRADGLPGSELSLEVSFKNRQRAHSMVTPMLSPMVSEKGVTWFPNANATPASLLLATNETGTITLNLVVPENVPQGCYRGALILYGFREGALPVRLDIGSVRPDKKKAPPVRGRKNNGRKKPASPGRKQ